MGPPHTDLNEKDRKANSHLPKLELFSSTGSPLPDSIRPNYDSAESPTHEAGSKSPGSQAEQGPGPLDGKTPGAQLPEGQRPPSSGSDVKNGAGSDTSAPTKDGSGQKDSAGEKTTEPNSNPSKTGFAEKLLDKIGAPVTPDNLKVLDAWQKAEGGSINNPFNSFLGEDGSSGSHAQPYSSIEAGVDATAKALESGAYKGILNSLRNGDNSREAAEAIAKSKWGTGAEISRIAP